MSLFAAPRLHVLVTCVIVGASLGAFIPAFRYAGEETTYATAATLRVEGPGAPRLGQDKARWQGLEIRVNDDLDSPELRRQANVAVRRRLPRTSFSGEIRVTADAEPDTSTFFITARGTDADYVPSYLGCLLDAYITTRDSDPDSREQWSIAEPVYEPREEKWAWVVPLLTGVLKGGAFGIIIASLWEWRRQKKLRALAQEVAGGSLPPRGRSGVAAAVWLVLGGILLGLLVQTVRLANRPPEFRSLAKLVILEEDYPGFQTDQHRALIASIESPELPRRVLKRMQLRHPDLKPVQTDVRVVQTRGTAQFSVLATGREPHHTRLFLDTFLEEFMVTDHPFGNKVVVQERATAAAENVEEWEPLLAAGALWGAAAGALLAALAWLLRRFKRPPPLLSGDEAPAQ